MGLGTMTEVYFRYRMHVPAELMEDVYWNTKTMGMGGKPESETPFDLAWGGNRPGDSWTGRMLHGNRAHFGPYIYAASPISAGYPFGVFHGVSNYQIGWNDIVLYYRMNTEGNADGAMRVWWNNMLMFDRQDIEWMEPGHPEVGISLLLMLYGSTPARSTVVHFADIELLVRS